MTSCQATIKKNKRTQFKLVSLSLQNYKPRLFFQKLKIKMLYIVMSYTVKRKLRFFFPTILFSFKILKSF